MINSVKTKKILSKWCIVVLAHIVNKTNEVVLRVRDSPVVQKFPNVFPNSLPRLALEKELKFSIELAPISETPYIMVRTKL